MSRPEASAWCRPDEARSCAQALDTTIHSARFSHRPFSPRARSSASPLEAVPLFRASLNLFAGLDRLGLFAHKQPSRHGVVHLLLSAGCLEHLLGEIDQALAVPAERDGLSEGVQRRRRLVG